MGPRDVACRFLSLIIFDHVERTQAGERIIPVGFSIGAAVAAYLGRHRPVAGLILVHALQLARSRGSRSLLVGSFREQRPRARPAAARRITAVVEGDDIAMRKERMQAEGRATISLRSVRPSSERAMSLAQS